MNVTELTKQLIALPSFVDGMQNEKPMSDFLAEYAREKFPWMTVTLQEVAPNRFNLFLRDSAPTQLLVVDQIDTVVPDSGWRTDPLVAVEDDRKLYGLGTSDSKGNVAAFLTALEAFGETRGLAMLLYVDEEYLFKGMKTFASSNVARSIDPKLILSIDGNGSSLGTGCRGLVEFTVRLRSESGHSANPAIHGALRPFISTWEAFDAWVRLRGTSSAQIAFIRSGLVVGETDEGLIFGQEGNRIPNFVEAKVEVRPSAGLGWAEIQSFWRERLRVYPNVEMEINPIFTYAGFATDRKRLCSVEDAVRSVQGSISYLDTSTFGYLDIAMLRELYPNAALCSFGVGELGVTHRANEYVSIDRLEEGVSVYKQILTNVLTEE